MKEGTIYDKATGRVMMTVVAPDEYGIFLQVRDANKQGVILGKQIDGQRFYIENEMELERPEMSISHSGEVYLSAGEVVKIEGIPEGAEVIFPGGKVQVDDGFIEWSSVEGGSFTFIVEKFPYKEVTINAIVG